jgi:hypothetical protein
MHHSLSPIKADGRTVIEASIHVRSPDRVVNIAHIPKSLTKQKLDRCPPYEVTVRPGATSDLRGVASVRRRGNAQVHPFRPLPARRRPIS